MSRLQHHSPRGLPSRFENSFPLADWANADPFWRWPAVLIAIFLLWGVAGYFDLQDLTHAAALLPALGAPRGETVIPFSPDARAADRLDRNAAAQAAASEPTDRQRRALIAAHIDGHDAGVTVGFNRAIRIGFWLGVAVAVPGTWGVLQVVHILREWGGIVSFLAGFFQ